MNKPTLLFLISFSIGFLAPLYSITAPNPLPVYIRFQKKAKEFQRNGPSDSVVFYLTNAYTLAPKSAKPSLATQVSTQLRKTRQYSKAIAWADSTLLHIPKTKKDNAFYSTFWFQKSADYWQLDKVDSSSKYLKKSIASASSKTKKLPLTPEHYVLWSKILAIQGKYDSSLWTIQKAKRLLPKDSSKNASLTVGVYEIEAKTYLEQGRFESAAASLTKASYYIRYLNGNSASTRKKLELEAVWANLYNRSGNTSKVLEPVSAILKYVEQSKDSSIAPLLLAANKEKGIYFFEKGKYIEATKALQEALDISQSLYGEKSLSSARILNHLALIYYEKSDFGQGLLLASQGRDIASLYLKDEYPDVAYLQSTIGLVYQAMDNASLSNMYFRQSLATLKKVLGNSHLDVAQMYNHLGVSEKMLGRIDSAEMYITKAQEIFDKVLSTDFHPHFAKVYNDMGTVSQSRTKYNRAIEQYVKSLRIYRKLFGQIHPDLAEGYFRVGELAKERADYKQALGYYQLAMNSNVVGYSDTSIFSLPQIQVVLSDYILLKTLASKAEVLEKWAKTTEIPSDSIQTKLKLHALQTYQTITMVIDKLRTGYVNEDSRIFLSEKTAFLYEKAIALALELSKRNASQDFKEMAFQFSEKGKAGILLSAIQEANAKKISGLPDSLLAKEKTLLSKIDKKDKALLLELKKGTKADSSHVAELKNDLFALRNQHTVFIQSLEEKFPAYHALKYNTKNTSIKDIQLGLLGPTNPQIKSKQTLLEYFVGQENIYIFLVQESLFDIKIIKKDSLFTPSIAGLRNGIIYKDATTYATSAYYFYQKLVAPFAEKLKNQEIMLIPDGILSQVPFQALLTQSVDEKTIGKSQKTGNYASWPYVVKSNPIRYNYSAKLAIEMKNNPSGDAPYDVLVFAPVFAPTSTAGMYQNGKKIPDEASLKALKALAFDSISQNSHHVSFLPSTTKEARKIYQMSSKSRLYMNQYACEEMVKQNDISQFKYLHFATHGLLNTNKPAYSGLYFAEDIQKKEDGILHSGEVFALKINAKLVTMSACQTGSGKIVKGEGLVGLSRGFIYAGAHNLLVSYWNVSDASTSKLMVKTYRKIVSNHPMPIALQKAQLQVLRQPKFSFPYYWAAFILIGQ